MVERVMLNCTFVQYLGASPTHGHDDVDVAKPRQISTKTVNKVVEKHPLDMAKPSSDAGFNKLPVAWAIPNLHKIKGLRSARTPGYGAASTRPIVHIVSKTP
jgi:hypothetical protein